jgi:hypothetical protein
MRPTLFQMTATVPEIESDGITDRPPVFKPMPPTEYMNPPESTVPAQGPEPSPAHQESQTAMAPQAALACEEPAMETPAPASNKRSAWLERVYCWVMSRQ